MNLFRNMRSKLRRKSGGGAIHPAADRVQAMAENLVAIEQE
jgi:hypothetical protein